jgi:hypothetical protein
LSACVVVPAAASSGEKSEKERGKDRRERTKHGGLL